MLAFTTFPEQTALSRAQERGPWRLPTGSEIRFKRLPVTERECVGVFKDLALLTP